MIFLTITLFALPGGLLQSYIDEKSEVKEKEIFNLSGIDAQQALSSIKVVKAFGQENNEIAKFESHLEKGNKGIKKFNILYGLSFAITDGVNYYASLILVIAGSTLTLNYVSIPFNLFS